MLPPCKSNRTLTCLVTACVVALSVGNVLADQPIDFVREIAPIFQQHCLRCHGPGKTSGDFSIESAGQVLTADILVAGDPAASHLVALISGDDPEMPKEGRPLNETEVEKIRRWIRQGAIWPSDFKLKQRSKADGTWWSLQPVAEVDAAGRRSNESYRSFCAEQACRAADRTIAASRSPHADSPALF